MQALARLASQIFASHVLPLSGALAYFMILENEINNEKDQVL